MCCGFRHGYGITPCSICNDGDKGWFEANTSDSPYDNSVEYFVTKNGAKLRALGSDIRTEDDIQKKIKSHSFGAIMG